ncbi:hypothetical protein NQ315_000601 [Exocentrus adspersus]|uniref:RNase H type-1 domain-containing protein n=1 Tax=Exocentrus adspersus TaxID=1586481 RepID=A0AAV8VNE9_9CUCU|nr:hypothetical protein NQ315_000601 [Exocentrus adspersus]
MESDAKDTAGQGALRRFGSTTIDLRGLVNLDKSTAIEIAQPHQMMTSSNSVLTRNTKILFWNVRTMNANKQNLVNLIQDHDPHMYNETWLKGGQFFHKKGYNIVRNDRVDGYGGVAPLLRTDIAYDRLASDRDFLPENIQTFIIRIKDLYIMNRYCPANIRLETNAWKNLLNYTTDRTAMIIGDPNGQNLLWGSDLTNYNGRLIATGLEETELVVLNTLSDGPSTRLTPPGSNNSAVDIIITSPEIAAISELEVTADVGSSDHFPILCQLKGQFAIECQQEPNVRPAGRKFKRANWGQCQTELKNFTNSTQIITLSKCLLMAPRKNIYLRQRNSGENYVEVPPLTITELNNVIDGKTDTAVGKDQISYSMIKHLPTNAKIYLLSLFNGTYRGSGFPGLVRTHFDYAAQTVNFNTIKYQNKLNKLQHQALRINSRSMKSTPIYTLLAECGEMNLKFRSQWLTITFLIKIFAVEEHPLQELLMDRSIVTRDRYSVFWTNKKPPVIITALEYILPHIDRLKKDAVLPCFAYEYEYLTREIEFDKLVLKKAYNNHHEFLDIVNNKFPGWCQIYIDGSLDPEERIVESGYSFRDRVPRYATICTAEMIAIYKAYSYCVGQEIKRAVVFSDSKSALEKVTRNKISKDMNCVSVKTKRLTIEARQNDINIELARIPGHTGILGKERADWNTNVGKLLDGTLDLQLDKADIITFLKSDFLTKWKAHWQNNQESFPSKPNYKKFPFINRKYNIQH